jgi:cytidylate kinase
MGTISIIAIDGPAASGKSTLGIRLAEKLGYLYFDTGVMYRAVAWSALEHGIDVADESRVASLAETIQIDVRPPSEDDGRVADVIVDGKDVTWSIRDAEVDATVSIVAAYPGVRAALTAKQRRVGLRGKVVMVGRDIGTVVLPEADLKLYLEASPQVRAKRRYQERQARDEVVSYESILESMRRRDRLDSTREVAPLQPAEDAILLDSEGLDAEQVFDKVITLLNDRCVGSDG